MAQEQGPCQTVLDAVRNVRPPAGGAVSWQSPLATLNRESKGVVTFDTTGWQGAGAALQARLRDEWRAPPDLLKVIVAQGQPTIYRFGTSDLYMSEVVAGTMDCEDDVFFEARSGTAARGVKSPLKEEPGLLCYWMTGRAGAVGGVPAFLVQDDRDNTVELTVTPWRDGKWQPACGVSLAFANRFEAIERFCAARGESGSCDAFADRALALARAADETPKPADGSAPAGTVTPDAPVEPDLPTFGHKVTAKDIQTTSFSEDTVFRRADVDGRRVLARIGHPSIGWRVWRDYLVAFYREDGDKLVPLAGIYVTKTRTELGDVKLTTP